MTMPRRQITDLDELAGKTIERAAKADYSDNIIIAFTDNTFAYFTTHDKTQGFGHRRRDLVFDELVGVYERVEFGLATPDEIAEKNRLDAEWDRRQQETEQRRKQEIRDAEWAAFQRLKLQFEGPTS